MIWLNIALCAEPLAYCALGKLVMLGSVTVLTTEVVVLDELVALAFALAWDALAAATVDFAEPPPQPASAATAKTAR